MPLTISVQKQFTSWTLIRGPRVPLLPSPSFGDFPKSVALEFPRKLRSAFPGLDRIRVYVRIAHVDTYLTHVHGRLYIKVWGTSQRVPRALFHCSSVHAVHSRLLWETPGFFRWNLSKQPSWQSIELPRASLLPTFPENSIPLSIYRLYRSYKIYTVTTHSASEGADGKLRFYQLPPSGISLWSMRK